MTHIADLDLWAFGRGELAAERTASVEAHLEACDPCRRRLDGLRIAHEAARALGGAPSPFASARMKRTLAARLDDEVWAQRAAWRPSRVAAALAFATLSGAAAAMTASGAWTRFLPEAPPARVEAPSEPEEAPAAPEGPSGADGWSAASEVVEVAAAAEDPPEPMESREAASGAVRKRPRRLAAARSRRDEPAPREPATARAWGGGGPRVAVAEGTPSPREAAEAARLALEGRPGAPGWVSAGDLYAQAGDARGAAEAYLEALSGADAGAAQARLRRLASEGAVDERWALAAVARHPEASQSAEGLRLLCEWGLKSRGDREAVGFCQAFGRAFPAHPAVHGLALAAGRTAETRLSDLPLALAEYSRALVVSEFADLPTSEALLHRARVLHQMGNEAEAQADLRLYLHVDPTAARRPEVAALASALAVPLPE